MAVADERVRAPAAAAALGGALAVAIASALFGASRAPREHVELWLALLAASALVLGAAALALARARGSAGVPLGAIVLAGAAALRLGALAAPVSLSDDVHRYAWDGALLARGHDPYASRPVEVAHLVGEAELERLNSPRYYSVYPPLAQLSFALAAALEDRGGPDATRALRALFAGADLAAVAALLAACARLRRSRAWALLYAWHPLAFWEVAAGGHTEALMLPLVLLALLAAEGDRPARAGALLGLAACAKLTALILGPALLVFAARRGGARAGACLGIAAAGAVLAGFAPFASATLIPNVGESLALYSRTFAFNAPVYYGARFLLGYREGWSEPVDGTLVPALAAATLAATLLLALAQDGTARRLVLGLAWTYLAHVLLSRVVHPWYLLAPLALFAAGGRAACAAYALSAPISYLSYAHGEAPGVVAAQALVLALALLVERAPIRHVTARGSPSGEPSLSRPGE